MTAGRSRLPGRVVLFVCSVIAVWLIAPLAASAQTVTVARPNGGERVYTSAPYTIEWTLTDTAGAVRSFDVFFTSGTSSGSFNWLVTGPATTTARVRVTALNTPVSDTSDAAFTIALPFLTLASPPLESNWGYGTQQRITWTTNLSGSDRITVKLSTDGGSTFPLTLASQVTASSGATTLTLPVLPARTDRAVLLVESATDPSVRSVSSYPFTIEPPFVLVLRPNLAGDVWPISTSRTIVWRDNLGALERVRIELSRDGGATFPTMLHSNTPADGSQAVSVSSGWTTTAARVRIVWTRNTAVLDGSDANFTIKSGVVNAAPIANAGADQAVRTGDTVTLNGGASSDPNGNSLTYAWTLLTKPAGSTAVLMRATFAQPYFVADQPGAYTVRLVVSDGVASSAADTVLVSASSNAAPVANAGPDALVNQGATVTLDGSGSTDPDGAALTWTWALVQQPAASQATLANASGPAPTFVADVSGTYLVQLVVGDGTQSSQPDSVVITANARPLANAGPDQTAPVGATVQLTGAASTDADGHPLTYAWSFQSRPTGSTATLSDPSLVDPTFRIDRPGSYVVRLVVSDPVGCERRDDGDHQHEQLRACGARRRGPVGARPRPRPARRVGVYRRRRRLAAVRLDPVEAGGQRGNSLQLHGPEADVHGGQAGRLRGHPRRARRGGIERSRQREHQHRQFRAGRTRR